MLTSATLFFGKLILVTCTCLPLDHKHKLSLPVYPWITSTNCHYLFTLGSQAQSVLTCLPLDHMLQQYRSRCSRTRQWTLWARGCSECCTLNLWSDTSQILLQTSSVCRHPCVHSALFCRSGDLCHLWHLQQANSAHKWIIKQNNMAKF